MWLVAPYDAPMRLVLVLCLVGTWACTGSDPGDGMNDGSIPDGSIPDGSIPDGPLTSSTITVSWSLVAGDANSPTGCPEETTIEVITEGASGLQIIDLFNCTDGGGIIEREPGVYTSWIRLTDDSGVIVYAMSTSTQVTVEQGADTPVAFTFPIDRGSFYLGWEITYDGAPSDCSEPGIGAVEVITTLVSDPNTWYDDHTLCNAYRATLPGRPLGEYVVSVALLDVANEQAVYVADPVEASIVYGNHLNDLGTFVLDAAGN
jgi:hypothetical protein